MGTRDEQLFIDAIIVKGVKRVFSVNIKVPSENNPSTEQNMDLSDYNVLFRVLGSAEGNGIVLIEKIITSDTNPETIGCIDEPESGNFTFVITAEESNLLGLGAFPIMIALIDPDTQEILGPLTEGGTYQGEFNKIRIVRT